MEVRPIRQVCLLLLRTYDKSDSINARKLAVAGLSHRVRAFAGTVFRCHVVLSLALVFAFVALFSTAAQAQTDPIWFTTITIGEPPEEDSHFRGYGHTDITFTDENVGSIEDDEYSYLGTDNRVLGVQASDGGVSISLEASLFGPDNNQDDVLVLEFAGEELPVAAAFKYRGNKLIVWDEFNTSWVSDNVPSLGSDRYETTLPVGGTVGVCLRTTGQTCPSLAPQVSATPEPSVRSEPIVVLLRARFRDVPLEHDGSTAFTMQIAFNEPIETTKEQMQQALMVTGGAVTSAQKVDGRSTLWEITITPNSNDDVRVSLPRTPSCFTVGAVCTSDGRMLSRSVAVSVARAPLTARFEDVPAGHYRTSAFTLQLAFSEPIEITAEQMQQVLTVTDGKLYSIQQVDDRSDLWEISVTPDSNDDVSLSLPQTASCEDANAICTADGRMLSRGVAVSVVRMPLTARFEEVPAGHHRHHPSSRCGLAFSEPIGITALTLERALTVTGDSLHSLPRMKGRSNLWEVKIQPNGSDVRISLPSDHFVRRRRCRLHPGRHSAPKRRAGRHPLPRIPKAPPSGLRSLVIINQDRPAPN